MIGYIRCGVYAQWSIYYSATRKKEILPFVTMWKDLEGIMLSEISQRKTSNVGYDLHMESKKAELVEAECSVVVPRAMG